MGDYYSYTRTMTNEDDTGTALVTIEPGIDVDVVFDALCIRNHLQRVNKIAKNIYFFILQIQNVFYHQTQS